jgi:hypothetical protein
MNNQPSRNVQPSTIDPNVLYIKPPEQNMTEEEEKLKEEAMKEADALATWNEASWKEVKNERKTIKICTNLSDKITDDSPLSKWMSQIGGFVSGATGLQSP